MPVINVERWNKVKCLSANEATCHNIERNSHIKSEDKWRWENHKAMLVYGPNTYERTFMSLFSLVIYWKWTILWHNCFQRSQWNTSAWKNMFFSLEVLMKTAEHYNLFSLWKHNAKNQHYPICNIQ